MKLQYRTDNTRISNIMNDNNMTKYKARSQDDN